MKTKSVFGKYFWGQLYLGWAGLVYVLSFLLLYPFFFICIKIKPLNWVTFLLNKVWCIFFFPGSLLFYKVDRRFRPQYGESYVYVANHGSYLDIPLLTWILPGFICFIGKYSLTKIPLFGFVFKNLHISVDRKNSSDRMLSMTRATEQIQQHRRPIVFFPEGTINAEAQPQLSGFKDGAFKVAIENKVKIVPITIPYNWILLPSHKKMFARWYKCEVIIHQAIETKHLQPEDYLSLKQQVFEILDTEINKHNTPAIIAQYGGKQRNS
jgi:1-acyl-sn-glycerol-3-phosphate acyltransferase